MLPGSLEGEWARLRPAMKPVLPRVRRCMGDCFRFAVDRLARSWRRAASRRALAAMDDRELRDIGLCRSDVYLEISKPFWRE
jgi:uncharacterized protein YjiS (DUF1127 family)